MHSKTYVTVRYAETDKMGVVYHGNYPVWFELGRSNLLNMHGYEYKKMEEMGVMTPVTNLTCNYKSPAFYPDNLLIRTWAINMTASRIEFRYTICRINEDKTETEVCYGTTEHAFVSTKTFRPVNLKKKIPNLYEKIKATF